MDFIKSRGEGHNPQPSAQPSYAEISHEEQDDNDGYKKLNKKDVILILDNKDLERRDEPWKLMERYLEAGSYPILPYKSRMHYETILMTTGDGILNGQELIEQITATMEDYTKLKNEQPKSEANSPFQHIARKIQLKKGVISKAEIISSYMAEVKRDLMKNLGEEFSSNTSMASVHTEEEDVQDSQDPYDADFDIQEYLAKFQENMEASSSSGKNKGKAEE
ncbi:hypothetical protein RND71_035238 [Anisodus tanguticus]|uniref:Uncharacterized protein n=1 Tax=Anisodus tanguticus TaxID=243964 RepID=A0AAE1R7C1_9SOLA|nr:hypothetical protein RND71_035238 [Anisodus tanguticus]